MSESIKKSFSRPSFSTGQKVVDVAHPDFAEFKSNKKKIMTGDEKGEIFEYKGSLREFFPSCH